MSTSNYTHTPVSHTLTRSSIQSWKDSIKQARQNCAFLEKWPCMYCQGDIDLNSLRDHTQFRCRNTKCVGVGKLQVTCFWDIRGS
ncbi:hypothetical protein COCMIDRAFT_105270 [Bipolaris oryzae ATCC 44560]|uniref:Uncharacterized protein n=1 Tax=Bipolaris oryzae ATCC 44560 TaxID=930090 RepID=W6YW39_COCMI|nr:uncharacterized protein COCMIDRAFT_105270 [Bipolaris oryzae ATCC 44560]EUC41760.1 hypothetical protein COCMIDRAFT_105270 [Bipolaris oryzae ATCC 44560]